MVQISIEMTSIGTLAISVFGVIFCFTQRRFSRVSRSFSAFLSVIALDSMPAAFSQIIGTFPRAYATFIDFATWPTSFFLAPLFWIYVFVLTSKGQQLPTKLARHFILPGAAVVLAVFVLGSSSAVRDNLFLAEPELNSPWAMTLVALLGLFQLAIYPQIAFYLFLILRRMLNFRLMLREVYASTEQHELRWIYVIGGLSIVFWLAQTLLFIATVDSEDSRATSAILIIASVVSFALVGAMTLWGLRQRPPLEPETGDAPIPDKGAAIGKYQKSALSPEASERLSRKLRRAMEVDHLYRDPNLSLWALAKHTGASPNYISQTLNESIGESFFDFVNSYRITEARTLLSTTDQSVLSITYDVGFNARSSFYNAFKRATGHTPSDYRKKMSQRDGLDDIERPLSDP